MKTVKFKNRNPLVMIAPKKIRENPNRPRKEFDPASLASLAGSIKENGMMQPLTVIKKQKEYVLITGERRLRAALELGMKKVPCLVVTASGEEAAVMALLENTHRKPLHFLEEAQSIEQLLYHRNLTPEEVAMKLGISGTLLWEKLELLTLTPWQRERIQSANLTEAHAKAFLKIGNEELRNDCILKTIARELTPPKTLALAEKMIKEQEMPPITRKTLLSDLRLLENTLNHAVTTLNRSGMKAKTQKKETDFLVEYTLQVEKTMGEEPKE